MADGTFLKYIEYDASQSPTQEDWFAADKFVSSSWDDLSGSGSYYSWSMESQ